MATLDRALQIAITAHAGHLDKQGRPYILHPLAVMQGVEGVEAQIVAVLHDVVEDSSVTLDDLRQAGFSSTILQAIRCVTHEKVEPYADYVIRCKQDPLARQVKMADLRDNARLDRVLMRADKLAADLRRLRRYVLAYKYLQNQISESEYRELAERLD